MSVVNTVPAGMWLSHSLHLAATPEPASDELSGDALLSREQILTRLHLTMRQDPLPLEAQTIYLHYVDGMTLPAITRLLDCQSKTGAKALLVSGMRKPRRSFKPWLARQG